MSCDHSVDTGCSVDTGGDSGICTDTVNTSHDIVSVASDSIGNHHNVLLNSPTSNNNPGTQTISDRNTSRTKKSRCSRRPSYMPCIRIIVFALIIVVLLLMCKMNICFKFILKLLSYSIQIIIVFLFIIFFFRVQKRK